MKRTPRRYNKFAVDKSDDSTYVFESVDKRYKYEQDKREGETPYTYLVRVLNSIGESFGIDYDHVNTSEGYDLYLWHHDVDSTTDDKISLYIDLFEGGALFKGDDGSNYNKLSIAITRVYRSKISNPSWLPEPAYPLMVNHSQETSISMYLAFDPNSMDSFMAGLDAFVNTIVTTLQNIFSETTYEY